MDRNIFEEEHGMFRDSVRSFMKNEIGPNAERWNEPVSYTHLRAHET